MKKIEPLAIPMNAPSSPAVPIFPAPAFSPSASAEPSGPGRPSCLDDGMIQALCSVIRTTGASDSGAAARMNLHPSTVSRWKRAFPELAIRFRAAREEFRSAQLEVIQVAAHAGGATGWRAAAWLLERIFPEDYAPRARERVQFQDRYDAVCASEAEGGLPAPPSKGESLQNVQNATPPPASLPSHAGIRSGTQAFLPELQLPEKASSGRDALEIRYAATPLQNVKKSPLAGPVCPAPLVTKCAA